MWMIKHIFDGDFGCEERAPGQEEMMVSVTLENDQGEVKYVTVADAWLTEKGLDVGAVWPKREENMLNNKTLKEVLEDPRLAKIAPDAISKWDLSAEEFYNWTLQEINDKMGWEASNLALQGFLRSQTGENTISRYIPPKSARKILRRWGETSCIFLRTVKAPGSGRTFSSFRAAGFTMCGALRRAGRWHGTLMSLATMCSF